MKTVKEISMREFDLVLVETESGMYKIFATTINGLVEMSEAVSDLNIALSLFDIKLQELEGH